MRLYDKESRFTTDEFACPCGCGFGSKFEHIEKNLIDKLNILRELFGKPMVVTSGARCAEYNKKIGGEDKSAHLPHSITGTCRAVDILVRSSEDRYNLMTLAFQIGFKRIGFGPNFLHLDVAWDLPSPVGFMY